MSPEQTRASPKLDHRCDLWSLATIGYQMVSGHLPVDGADVEELMKNLCAGRIVPLRQRSPSLPEAQIESLSAFFDRAFADRVDDRFEGAAGLAQAFDLACGETSRVTLPPSAPSAPDNTLGSTATEFSASVAGRCPPRVSPSTEEARAGLRGSRAGARPRRRRGSRRMAQRSKYGPLRPTRRAHWRRPSRRSPRSRDRSSRRAPLRSPTRQRRARGRPRKAPRHRSRAPPLQRRAIRRSSGLPPSRRPKRARRRPPTPPPRARREPIRAIRDRPTTGTMCSDPFRLDYPDPVS